MSTYSNLTAINAALREVLKYDPVKSQTVEMSAMLWDWVKKGTPSEINDRNAFIIKTVNPAAVIVANSAEFADYAPPSNQSYLKTSIPIRRMTKTYSVSGAVRRQNKTGTTLLDTIVSDTKDVEDMFNKQMNYAAHGDGTDEIAKASGISSLVVTCNSTTNLFGTRHVFIGEKVEFRSSGGTLRTGGVSWSTVTAVDLSAKTFTVDAIPSDATTNDLVYNYNSYNGQIRGLGYHVAATGAWQGVADRTAYRGLSSVVVSAASAYLSRALLDLVIGELEYKFGDDQPLGEMMAYMSRGQVAQFKSLGYDLQRYNGPDKGLNTGFVSDALQHGNLMVKGSVDCPLDKVYIGNIMGLMQRFETIPMQWVAAPAFDGGDNYMFQANAASGQGKADGFFMMMEWEGNTGVWQPDHVALLSSLGFAGLPSGNLN